MTFTQSIKEGLGSQLETTRRHLSTLLSTEQVMKNLDESSEAMGELGKILERSSSDLLQSSRDLLITLRELVKRVGSED